MVLHNPMLRIYFKSSDLFMFWKKEPSELKTLLEVLAEDHFQNRFLIWRSFMCDDSRSGKQEVHLSPKPKI